VFVLFFVLLTILFFISKTQGQCDTQNDSVTGYPAEEFAELKGITNDLEQLLLRLKQEGANFIPTNGYSVTTNWRMTGAASDFNGDNLVDLAEGGRRCDYHTDEILGNMDPDDTNLSIFISHGRQEPPNDNKFDFDGPYYIDYSETFETYEIIGLGAGDYDGDGDSDIAALSWAGNLWIFKNLFVENGLLPGEIPVFDETPTWVMDVIDDGYGEFDGEFEIDDSHWRWESNIGSVDIDGDYDLDLIVGVPTKYGQYGQVVIFYNDGGGNFSRSETNIDPYPSGAKHKYGVCAVAPGDFDEDGDIDFVVGSVDSRDLHFYKNDGLGDFEKDKDRKIKIPEDQGSCTLLREGDLEGDGDMDFVMATDGHVNNPPGGYVFWYENDGTGYFTLHPVPNDGSQISPSEDLDSGALGDFDNDEDIDFFVADGNDSQNCYFMMNDVFPFYVEQGSLSSKNLLTCSFLTSEYAIVIATLFADDSTPSGTAIEYYLSNSNDENGSPIWEKVTSGEEYVFEAPGIFLRWKAEFSTEDIYVTPKIYDITIDYEFISKREYSRTSHAFALADVDSEREGDEEVLYSASFEFPRWRGHLRSWNVTSLSLPYTNESQLEDIINVGAEFVMDAGERLETRVYDTRDVFTAYDDEGDGIMNDRLDFKVSEKDRLDDYLGLGEESPEVEPLIKFVLGYNRDWKLGDINHSSPQVLEPPSRNPAKMGPGYDTFKSNNTNRKEVILAGANDGMLHCFDPVTLDELWAFIPHNLLSKLKKMRIVDQECGEYLSHHFFVDGTPAIGDVYFGSAWHTILISGQGMGWGEDHKNYYFALDITDPLNPEPLWELTDDTMGETWSVPAIGKVDSTGKWVAFFGSGYDNDLDEEIGNYFYVVDVENGTIIESFEISENPEPDSPFGIQNTIPASPAIGDYDEDGYVESVYFGDLKGRLWKIDVDQWSLDVIYRDPYNHPIISKPAVHRDSTDGSIHLYFGTGGDDEATSDVTYSFIALKDDGSPAVEWYLGSDDLASELGISEALKKEEFGEGEKVWADPVISNRMIYIATLWGSVENLNPCQTLEGTGKIYARYAWGEGAGGSALFGPGGELLSFLEAQQKVRSAVTVGKIQEITQEEETIKKRKVFIQSFTQPTDGANQEPPSEVLAQPVAWQTRLLIKSWRETYKIIK